MAKARATSSALPTHGEIKKPLIAFLRQHPEISLREAVAFIAKRFHLSPAAQKRRQGCGKETVLQNRIRWALWELKRDGLVRSPGRGFYRWK